MPTNPAIPRLLATASRAVGPVPQAAGVGDVPALDPVADAQQQLASLQAYFAVLAAGGNPTASQLAAAQEAVGAIGADLRALQTASTPSGQKVWVSAPAAASMALGAGLVGTIAGWWARGAKGK